MEIHATTEIVPEGYDPDVWNSLPPDIKEELCPSCPPPPPPQNHRLGRSNGSTQSFISFSKSKSPGTAVKDDTFPPSYKSIDGRNISSNTSPVVVPSCACNRPMTLSRVSRIGKNRGRHYYACGKKTCHAYLWADHIAHPEPPGGIVWMPFTEDYGWKLVNGDGFRAGENPALPKQQTHRAPPHPHIYTPLLPLYTYVDHTSY